MARSKQSVQESAEVLNSLAQQYHDPAQLIRIRMLQALREDPSRTLAEVADIIGSSERTVQRWWGTYCSEGLEAMVEIKPRGGKKPKRIGDAELKALQQKVRTAEFSKLDEARTWLHREHGVHYSRSGLWYLMQTQVQSQPSAPQRPSTLTTPKSAPVPKSAAAPEQSTEASPSGPFPPHIIKFLNALPTVGDTVEWGPKFYEALREVLGDVDRISLNINFKCSLDKPTEYQPDTVISQFPVGGSSTDAAFVFTSDQSDGPSSERLLENFRRKGFPFDQYQDPQCFDYIYGGYAYLGTIILWRESHKPPISEATLYTLKVLEPFIVFMLSDLVARHQSQHPVDQAFYDAVAEMVADAQLSKQEKRIAILRLMGHSYKDLADNLHITVDTIKKHLTQIHRKTQTSGMAELFAKYFSARLIPRDFTD